MAQLLNFITAKKANLTLCDRFTIGIETGIQNAQIAITIVQMVYLSQPYIFAQQFFFPIIAFAFQVKKEFVNRLKWFRLNRSVPNRTQMMHEKSI